MSESFQLTANVADVLHQAFFKGVLTVSEGRIAGVERLGDPDEHLPWVMPGFVDAHVHVESSMLTPCEFARMAVVHGTVATVSDPHEIANVLGLTGVQYMLDNAALTPFRFYFGAPSCVPATAFETAGAVLGLAEIEQLFALPGVKYLSEMMNYPGVLNADPEVMAKIALARQYGKQVDGHAPGLRGEAARQYIAAGISTDHECFTYEEALEKIGYGMKILIREGSAAKNFDALVPLLRSHPDRIMFCSDDKHPNDLVVGHIDQLVRRAVQDGYPVIDVLRAACVNPVLHYGLETGLLRPGDPADLIVVDNLRDFHVQQTYLGGQLVAEKGQSRLPYQPAPLLNHFDVSPKRVSDFVVRADGPDLNVIEALEGQLITRALQLPAQVDATGNVIADPSRDLLKITVVNRYRDAPPAVAFIRGFGLQRGAIAGSVAHDSHNIVAVGADDESLCAAVNAVIAQQGGLAVADENGAGVLPLPLAGIMTTADGYEVARQYTLLDARAKALGSQLYAPFMTLSFMALLVIPSLKLSDLGLFDGDRFRFTSLFCGTEAGHAGL